MFEVSECLGRRGESELPFSVFCDSFSSEITTLTTVYPERLPDHPTPRTNV